jgi:hypothetical protein
MKIRSAIMGVVGALLASETAMALSCARPDLARTMEDAKASDTVYHILVGSFTEARPTHKIPRGYDGVHHNRSGIYDPFKPKPPQRIKTWFKGYSLTPNPRYDVKLSRFPVVVETSCVGPWCSSVPSSSVRQIAFVEARPGRAPILRVSPCPDKIFPLGEREKNVRKLRDCFDRPCKVEQGYW